MTRTALILSCIVCAAGFGAAEARADTAAYGIALQPGETVVGTVVTAPGIVRVPLPAPVAERMAHAPAAPLRTAPPREVDPATGRMRNRSGWSGDTSAAAGIACFPAGVCAHLNR